MKKILLCLLFIGLVFQCSAQLFQYNETFKNATAQKVFFGGFPRKAFLTANPDSAKVVKDAIGQGYLRLTSAENNQKGYIYCTEQFSSAQGFSIQFEYFTYAENKGGADGITFFMFDAEAVNNNNFNIGGFGGSLGYAPFNANGTVSEGLSKAYIGVGIDEYGNFKMMREGRTTGIDPGGDPYPPRNSLTVRGPAPLYAFVKSVETETAHGFQIGTGVIRATDPRSDGYRKVFIDLERINGDSNNGYHLTVKMQIGSADLKVITLIDKLEYKYAPPSKLMYGIASSTGDSKNYHEIRNVRINSFDVDEPGAPFAKDDSGINGISKKTISIDVLQNDTAATGRTIPKDSVFLDQPQSVNGGTIAVDKSTGQITYRPKDGFYGNDSFTYYVKDDQGEKSNIATVFITVKKPPVGKPSEFTVVIQNETQLPVGVFDLKSSYSAAELTGLSFVPTSELPKSTFAWAGNGKFTIQPKRGLFEDSFSYQLMDADSLLSDTILVKIKILYAPVAKNDKKYLVAGLPAALFVVQENDYDPDGVLSKDDLASTLVETQFPKNPGTPRGKYYEYQAPSTFTGPDEFIYTIRDERKPEPNISDPAKVEILVYPRPSIGVAKTATIKEVKDYSYDITYKIYIKNLVSYLPNIPANEQMVLTKVGITDDLAKAFGNRPFSIKSLSVLGQNSTLYLNPDYTGKKLNAQDVNSIQLLNQSVSSLDPGASDSIELVVNVKVNGELSVPTNNVADAYAEFEKLTVPQLEKQTTDMSYDGTDPGLKSLDAPTFRTLPVPERPQTKFAQLERYVDEPAFIIDIIDSLVTATGGKKIDRSSLKLTRTGGSNVDFTIEPDFKVKFSHNGVIGSSQFTYSIKDELGVESNSVTGNNIILVKIKPAPTGKPDVFYTLTNKEHKDVNILQNDGTPAEIATYDIILDAPGMKLTENAVRGSFTYEPPTDQYGQFNFSYKVRFFNDLNKVSASIPVIIYVNNPPTAVDKDYKTAINTPITIDLASLGTDLDGIISRAAGSVKIMNADFKGGTFDPDPSNPGAFIFTPKTNFKGTVAFRYTVEDDFDIRARGISEPKVITIEVGDGIVQPPANNKIGLSKHLAGLSPGPNGSFDVRYVFTIKNYGQEVLNNVGLTDDLGLAFNDAQFMLTSLKAQGGLVSNNSYNGFALTEVLDKANSSLQPGASGTVEMVVNVKLLEKEGIFINTAIAEGQPAGGGAKAVDQSTSGMSPDPAGNGDVSPKDPTLVELLFPRLFIPGGFSPNNDGTNDKFVIRNVKDKKIAIEIFNRWGNRVYKSGDYQNDWDGRCTEGISLGQDLPPGTYFYVIILDGKDKFTGHITLNR